MLYVLKNNIYAGVLKKKLQLDSNELFEGLYD